MDDIVLIKKGAPRPIAWVVECATCGNSVECTMNESDDGATWKSGDWYGDPFVPCGCGTVIEPTPVVVTDAETT